MNWTDEKLILAPLSALDAADAITQLGKLLYKLGYVRDTFIDAVLEREKTYPTGLPTQEIYVAIPHTDPLHVIRPAIAIGMLDKPVAFCEMGNPASTLDVQIICLLAMAETQSLVILLRSLVGIFQDTHFLREILAARNPAQIAEMFDQRLPEFKEA